MVCRGFVWELSCFKASTGLFWPQQITERLRLERNLKIIHLLCHNLLLPQPQVVQTNFLFVSTHQKMVLIHRHHLKPNQATASLGLKFTTMIFRFESKETE